MSPRVLTSTLRSLFTVYTANQASGLQYSCSLQRIHPEIESNILTHWCGDRHELLTPLLQRSDSHHNYLLGICA